MLRSMGPHGVGVQGWIVECSVTPIVVIFVFRLPTFHDE